MSCQWDFHPDDYSRQYWLNETDFSHQIIIDQFLNQYKHLMRYQCRSSLLVGYILILLGCLGILGSLSALITLSQLIFYQPTFFYFRAINAIQLIYMIFIIEFGIEQFHHTELTYLQYYIWAMVVIYGHGRGLINIFPSLVNLIVLAAAVERAIACHCVRYFQKINKKWICTTVIGIGFLICFFIYFPHIFAVKLVYVENFAIKSYGMHQDPISFYTATPTEWASSNGAIFYQNFVDSLVIVGVVLHCVTAILVIWGLMTSAHRNRTLIISDTSSQFIDLCYLQICETIPFAISHILRVISYQFPVNEYLVLPKSAYHIPQAMKNLNIAKAGITLQSLTIIFSAIAHSMSFYFYLAFCPSVRRGFVQLIQKVNGKRCRAVTTRQNQSSETELQTMRAKM